MKKILIYISLVSAITQVGCTKGFQSVNTDPTRASATVFDPNLLLPSIEYNYVNGNAGYNGPILFESMWVQVFASTSSLSANYYSNADKYVATSGTPGYISNAWGVLFGGASYAYEMRSLCQGKPSLSNLAGIGLITQIMSLQSITDVYGDIPYSQALQGKAGVSLPVYDKQQDIYTSMLAQLDSVIPTLDASKPIPTNDAFPYKGNIAQWKKFGYSLMLKIAMRLTKVDPATAQKYAEKAATGGTFAGIADDAYLLCDNADGYGNGNASALVVDVYEVRWSKPLIDYLRLNADPRLGVIGEVPAAGLAANNSTAAGTSDSSVQIGLPNGYDLFSGATNIANSPGYPGSTGTGADITPLGKYSRPRSSLYRNLSGVIYVLTYAETELLFAEAAARGWSVGATASVHYANGVSGALQTLSHLGSDAVISASTANTFAAAHPLDISSLDNSLKQINEQYWATNGSFLNFIEAWNNWRRSGYPVLTPVNYTGNFSNGTIPRREVYPSGEATQNPVNYKDAVSRLTGGDKYTSHMWWDK